MKKIDLAPLSGSHAAILRLATAVNDAIDAGGDVSVDLNGLDPRPKLAHIEVVKSKLDDLGLWSKVSGSNLLIAESEPDLELDDAASVDEDDTPDPVPEVSGDEEQPVDDSADVEQ